MLHRIWAVLDFNGQDREEMDSKENVDVTDDDDQIIRNLKNQKVLQENLPYTVDRKSNGEIGVRCNNKEIIVLRPNKKAPKNFINLGTLPNKRS